jgi:hypothetical protein
MSRITNTAYEDLKPLKEGSGLPRYRYLVDFVLNGAGEAEELRGGNGGGEPHLRLQPVVCIRTYHIVVRAQGSLNMADAGSYTSFGPFQPRKNPGAGNKPDSSQRT